MEIYKAIGVRDWETHRVILGSVGVDYPNPFESQEESITVEDIRRRSLGDRYNDVVDIGDPEISDGFGYEVEHA